MCTTHTYSLTFYRRNFPYWSVGTLWMNEVNHVFMSVCLLVYV